jgi:hypothetical protein
MEFLPSKPAPKKGESTGGKPPVPCAYRTYEMGRSKWPDRKSPFSHPAFKDGMEQRPDAWPPQGDPGAYDPYFYADEGTNPKFNSSNKARKAFDSTEVRTLRANLFGIDTPSIGAYPVFQPEKTIGELDDNVRYPKLDASKASFNSHSLQRPNAKSFVPSPGEYNPNIYAILPAMGDSGAHMRSGADRFYDKKFEPMTDPVVGPGTYDQFEQTLAEDCDKAIERSSRTKPAFSTTMPQRALPFYAQGTPAPGSYEPMEPRLKDLYGEDRRNVL